MYVCKNITEHISLSVCVCKNKVGKKERKVYINIYIYEFVLFYQAEKKQTINRIK